jgi:polysaccharide deacetylase 2 family uncharacterized protein YibQ
VIMEKKKTRLFKKAPKTKIRSAKKKPDRLITKRYLIIGISLLLILACGTGLLIHLIGRGRADRTLPTPSVSEALGPSIGEGEARLLIGELNEKIAGTLAELGMSSETLTGRTEAAHTEGGFEYTLIEERYTLPAGVTVQEIKERLSNGVTGYPGLLKIESREATDGTEMTVYAWGVPIRDMTFSPAKPPPPPPRKPLPKVAIIIDDMGSNDNFVSDLLALKYPITLSVLPHQPRSAETAERAYKKGREVMLHLPMEPIDYPTYNPGPGALFTFMTDDEFFAALTGDLAAVPYISGVNNHMGSLLTQDRARMEIVLKEIKRRGLFFVDSKTGPRSIAYETAVNLGVPTAARDVFLDNESDVGKIKACIAELIGKAKKNGRALGICHPRPETIKALKEMERELSGSEVEMVKVKDLVK